MIISSEHFYLFIRDSPFLIDLDNHCISLLHYLNIIDSSSTTGCKTTAGCEVTFYPANKNIPFTVFQQRMSYQWFLFVTAILVSIKMIMSA